MFTVEFIIASICNFLFSAVVSSIITKIQLSYYYKIKAQRLMDKLIKLSDIFIQTYDKFETYLDKNIKKKEFIPLLKKRGLINEDYIIISFNGNKPDEKIDSIEMLRWNLLSLGKSIYNIDEILKMYSDIGVENIEKYCKFSQQFEKLKRICTFYDSKDRVVIVNPVCKKS